MDLPGRVALLTGGRRIGAVVASALARAGADVALVYNRSQAEAHQTAAEVRGAGRRALVLQADVSNAADCARLVGDTVGALGRLDIVIHMASRYAARPFDELTAEDWDAQLAVDLRAAFLIAKAAVPAMRHTGGGRIINVADWTPASGRPRYEGYLPYYVAKAGVIALTEALGLELAQDRILVNAVAPGPILAPPGTSDEERQAVERATPLGRWGGEAEIAKAVLFLVQSDFVTGETVRVDGGRHLT